MWISPHWNDYELLDASDGARLERWGAYVLERPDPQAVWKTGRVHPRWRNPDAVYKRSDTGGGAWNRHSLPGAWQIGYRDLRFMVKPMSFKHTGLFPEQAANWDAARDLITRHGKPVRVLNLFAYTGAATVACAKAGAEVTHVDAAKGMVAWAKENAALNGVEARWIVEDCRRFIEREIRRGSRYDALIMDPPSYGRGPGGEIWKLEDNLYDFLVLTAQLLSDDAAFVFINSYTTGLAPGVLTFLLDAVITARLGGMSEAGELGLVISGADAPRKLKTAGLVLPCGATGRWIHY